MNLLLSPALVSFSSLLRKTCVGTWRAAGCVGAGPRGSAAGGGIAGVMPEVGREGWGCPGIGAVAKD